MRRKLILGMGLALGVMALSGCGDEVPTSIGGELIGEGYRTYEVVLEASEFLQDDTTYDGLGALSQVDFTVVAEAFEGELFAHTLFRVDRPTEVTYENAAGVEITDSVFSIVGGVITIVVDSLGDDARTTQLDVLEVTESWHRGSVTWDLRSDTAGVAEAWTEPGGTTGRRLGGARSLTGDTIEIPLDSAAAAVWSDSASAFHGGLIRSARSGTRLRIHSLDLSLSIRPEGADTIISAGSAVSPMTVVTPDPSEPEDTELRVGGVPLWRSALQFQPLEDVEIPCAAEPTGCTVPLSDVHVNLAGILLEPRAVGPRRIERPVRIQGRAVLRAPGVPLSRSALTPPLGTMAEAMTPELFTGAPDLGPVVVPVTRYLRRNLRPVNEEEPILWVALLTQSEQSQPIFGYTSFWSTETPHAPRLRLVVTVPAGEDQ